MISDLNELTLDLLDTYSTDNKDETALHSGTSFGAFAEAEELVVKRDAATQMAELRRAIDRLPENQKYVVGSCFGLGGMASLSLTDIAKDLGISPQSACDLKRRALEALAEQIPKD